MGPAENSKAARRDTQTNDRDAAKTAVAASRRLGSAPYNSEGGPRLTAQLQAVPPPMFLRNEPISVSITFRWIRCIYRDLCRLQSCLQMGSFWKTNPFRNAPARSHYPSGLETARGGLATSQGARLMGCKMQVWERIQDGIAAKAMWVEVNMTMIGKQIDLPGQGGGLL